MKIKNPHIEAYEEQGGIVSKGTTIAGKKPSQCFCADSKMLAEKCRKLQRERNALYDALAAIANGPTLPISRELVTAKAQAIYVAQWSQEAAKKAIGKQS